MTPKIRIDTTADNKGPVEASREIGLQPEALLRHRRQRPDGQMGDRLVVGRTVDEQSSAMLTGSIEDAQR